MIRVDALTDKGTPYSYWTRDLPPIPAQFLDSVAYLYPDRGHAVLRSGVGGSGFLVSMALTADQRALYVVTNRHVGDKAQAARLGTNDGSTEVIDTPSGGWKFPKDPNEDLAVFPLKLAPADALRFPAIEAQTFVSADDALVPGEDTFFLGRFISEEDRQGDAPVARFGHLAMRGTEVIHTQRGTDQESFLVEALSVGGYSGSAVVVFQPFVTAHTSGALAEIGIGSRIETPVLVHNPRLLGVNWGHLPAKAKAPVKDSSGNPVPGGLYVRHNSGVAGVVPAWKITELLQRKDLVKKREEQREAIERATEGAGALDSADEGGSEFERFEDLTRKLVNTPKSEVDEKRKEET